MASKYSIDIVIPTYNAKSLLEKHLGNTLKNSNEINKIIIVDDGSTDDTANFLKTNFPEITYLPHKENLGFTKSINLGVKESSADFIILLNNDVEPHEGYIKNSLEYFSDPLVFAVTFNEKNSSWPMVLFTDGKLQFTRGEDKTKARFSGWASGGSAIFKREIWDKIGGLDEVYAPAYWEDIDIGWRAWKMGYKIIWTPDANVLHEHEASYGKKKPNFLNSLKQRNELLFNWRNITDGNLVAKHRQFLFFHTLLHPGYIKVIVSALIRNFSSPRVNKFVIKDAQILNTINLPYEN